MPTPASLLAALSPVRDTVAGLDLTDPDGARHQLEEAFPYAALGELRAMLTDAADAGWLTPSEGGPGIRFGRLAKPSEATRGFSIDVVDMEGVGLAHTHPRGEISLAIARSGTPRFDGYPEGWVVLGPGTHHAPTVTGGRMLIVYFLPGGQVHWDR